jgi:hypothetical protein
LYYRLVLTILTLSLPLGKCLVTSAPFKRVVKAFMVNFNLLDPGKSTIVKAPL